MIRELNDNFNYCRSFDDDHLRRLRFIGSWRDFAAHVLGNKLYARATLTGNMGTVLNAEFSNESNTRGNTKGVAQDNKGNVFKVSVYN
jgi:hypothetical protein